jgi:hypothetical protein
MNETISIHLNCKNPETEAHPFSLGPITITDNTADWETWKNGWKSRKITCPQCNYVAQYSHEDLIPEVLADKKPHS